MRQSNFELLRIVSMMLVLLIHCDYPSLGMPQFDEITTCPQESWVKIFFNVFSSNCVNLFILISGYFAIRPSIKSVLNLIFMILFYRVGLAVIATIMGVYNVAQALNFIIPGNGDWFTASYILLLTVAPFINYLIDNQPNNRGGYLLIFIVVFYGLEFCFGWITRYWKDFAQGYSVISLIGLYAIGRYIRLYAPKIKLNFKLELLSYLISVLLISFLMFWLLQITSANLKM